MEGIKAAHKNLEETPHTLGNKVIKLIIHLICANLLSNMQVKIFELMPEGTCKVVLTTNIAETLITLDGIDFVIDSGFVKQDSYSQGPGCLPWSLYRQVYCALFCLFVGWLWVLQCAQASVGHVGLARACGAIGSHSSRGWASREVRGRNRRSR